MSLPPRNQWNEKLLMEYFEQSLEEGGGVVCCEAAFELEPTDDQSAADRPARSVNGTASVEEISRTGLLIRIQGLDLAHFNEKNPVVLASHRPVSSGLMPGAIATIEKAYKTQGNTQLKFRNMTFDTDPIADAWYQKIQKGLVRMTSVGVGPIEARYVEETRGRGKNEKLVRYIELIESELREISVVAVGANRGAYLDPPRGRQSAGDTQALLQLTERLNALEAETKRIRDLEQGLMDRVAKLSAEREASAVSRLLDAASAVRRIN